MSVDKFYDDFSDHQMEMGINHRHLSIHRYLERFGLENDHSVLEVGCGIGTVSELVLRSLSPNGDLLGIDISEKSIQIANDSLKKYGNAKFHVHDLCSKEIGNQFDVIIMPDVIEHIPLNLHKKLFQNVGKCLKDSGFVFIHIPDPNYLELSVRNNSPGLQVIDQPIHSHLLAENILNTSLYIHYLESYSIYNQCSDYQAIILRKIPQEDRYQNVTPPPESLMKRLRKKIKYQLRGRK